MRSLTDYETGNHSMQKVRNRNTNRERYETRDKILLTVRRNPQVFINQIEQLHAALSAEDIEYIPGGNNAAGT